MNGALLMRSLAKECAFNLTLQQSEQISERHKSLLEIVLREPRPTHGSVELLERLRELKIPHGLQPQAKRTMPNRHWQP